MNIYEPFSSIHVMRAIAIHILGVYYIVHTAGFVYTRMVYEWAELSADVFIACVERFRRPDARVVTNLWSYNPTYQTA